MLILFDIDATMITTCGAGMRALKAAGASLFGPRFTIEGIKFAGRLDPLIISDMLVANGIAETPEVLATFRSVYREELPKSLRDPATVARSLPGVVELLEAVKKHDHSAVGLLTGNFEETGSLKLRFCGIDPEVFNIRVWGDESPSTPPRRDDLPGVALRRYRERHGRDIDPRRGVVIGDTPHDVSCAKKHGLRSLAVATGSFTVDDLRGCTPDRVVTDLSNTADILEWLTRSP